MVLNGLLNTLWLNTDVSLCGGSTAVLQQSLNQDYVIAVGLVDLCGIPFAEAVGADSLIAQVVADRVKLLLDHPFCDGKDDLRAPDPIAQTIILDVLIEY